MIKTSIKITAIWSLSPSMHICCNMCTGYKSVNWRGVNTLPPASTDTALKMPFQFKISIYKNSLTFDHCHPPCNAIYISSGNELINLHRVWISGHLLQLPLTLFFFFGGKTSVMFNCLLFTATTSKGKVCLNSEEMSKGKKHERNINRKNIFRDVTSCAPYTS